MVCPWDKVNVSKIRPFLKCCESAHSLRKISFFLNFHTYPASNYFCRKFLHSFCLQTLLRKVQANKILDQIQCFNKTFCECQVFGIFAVISCNLSLTNNGFFSLFFTVRTNTSLLHFIIFMIYAAIQTL